MTLDLYIARRFLGSFLRVFAVFLGVLTLIDLIEQIRRFSATNISLTEALFMALLNVPQNLYRILPLLMVLAGITLFLGLAKSSELVVVRAAGRSGLRFLLSPVVTALAIGAFAVTVLNPLVAATSKAYDQRSAARMTGSDGTHRYFAVPVAVWGGAPVGEATSVFRYEKPPEEEHLGVFFNVTVTLRMLFGINLLYVLYGGTATLAAVAAFQSFAFTGNAPFILDGNAADPEDPEATLILKGGGASQ